MAGRSAALTRVSSSTKETLGSDKKTLKSWHDRINQVNVKFTCIVSIYKPARLIIRLLFRFASDSVFDKLNQIYKYWEGNVSSTIPWHCQFNELNYGKSAAKIGFLLQQALFTNHRQVWIFYQMHSKGFDWLTVETAAKSCGRNLQWNSSWIASSFWKRLQRGVVICSPLLTSFCKWICWTRSII